MPQDTTGPETTPDGYTTNVSTSQAHFDLVDYTTENRMRTIPSPARNRIVANSARRKRKPSKAPRPARHRARTQIPWHRWAIPIVGETTAGTGAILIPVMVGQFINQHIAGKAPDAWPMFWVVVAAITFIVINEFFGWGTSMTLSAELGRDWRIYINRLMGAPALA